MKLFLVLVLLPLIHAGPTHTNTPKVYHPNSVISGDLVPFHEIEGTDLYTGVYYHLSMKKFPKGVISYTETKTTGKEGNFVQVDQNPKNLPNYEEGQKWFHAVQWVLEPAQTEGYYVIRNRELTTGVVAYLKDAGTGYRHVVIVTEPELVKKLSPGGPLYSNTLVKVVKTVDKGQFKYQLKFKDFPEGIVTWTETKYGDYNYYIQISDTQVPKYQTGGEFYDDTLFSFEPVVSKDVTLQGYVSHIDLTDATPVVLETYQKNLKTTTERRLVVENPSSSKIVQNVSISYSNLDKVVGSIKINDKLPTGLNLNLKFKIPRLKVYGETIRSPTQIVEETKATDIQDAKVTTKVVEIYKEVVIPPKTKVDISVVTYKLENVKLPFRAWVVVTGEGDRLKSDHSGSAKGLLPVQAVSTFLKNNNFEGEHFRIVGDKVIILVNGVLQGNFNVGWDIVA